MLINPKFLNTESFLASVISHYHDQEKGNEHKCSDPNCGYEIIQSFFKEFLIDGATFKGIKLETKLSKTNPLLLLKESKQSIEDYDWENIVKINNIKLKDIEQNIIIDAIFNDNAFVEINGHRHSILNVNVYCKPQEVNGEKGVLILPLIHINDGNEGARLLELISVFATEDNGKLVFDCLNKPYENKSTQELLSFVKVGLSAFFTAISLSKIEKKSDISYQEYSRSVIEENIHNLFKKEELKHGSLFEALTETFIENTGLSDESKEKMREIANKIKNTNVDEVFKDITSQQQSFGLEFQQDYLTSLMNIIYDKSYKERFIYINSTQKAERKKNIYKHFLKDFYSEKHELIMVIDFANHLESLDLHQNEDAFVQMLDYDWNSLANNINFSIPDLPPVTLFTSDIHNSELNDEDQISLLHSFIMPRKINGIKGFVFNVTHTHIDTEDYDYSDTFYLRDLKSLFFFGVSKEGYSLWKLDENLENAIEIKDSGMDSNLNQFVGAQLSAIIIYLNALNYNEVNYYYEINCLESLKEG